MALKARLLIGRLPGKLRALVGPAGCAKGAGLRCVSGVVEDRFGLDGGVKLAAELYSSAARPGARRGASKGQAKGRQRAGKIGKAAD